MLINRNQRKRQFIQWLLEHFRHSNEEVNQFLYYLMTEPQAITYVAFTEASHYTPNGIYISYKTKTDTPFVYYKQHKQFFLPEQVFHDFRLNMQVRQEPFYFEIDIPNIYLVLYEFNVFDENPYLPPNPNVESFLSQDLDTLSRQVRLKQLREKIDQSLLEKDYAQVEYYLELLEQEKGE